MGTTPPTVLYGSFRNFIGVSVIVRQYACGFGYNSQIFFVTFLQV